MHRIECNRRSCWPLKLRSLHLLLILPDSTNFRKMKVWMTESSTNLKMLGSCWNIFVSNKNRKGFYSTLKCTFLHSFSFDAVSQHLGQCYVTTCLFQVVKFVYLRSYQGQVNVHVLDKKLHAVFFLLVHISKAAFIFAIIFLLTSSVLGASTA